jgi:hypothetical protein
MCVKLVIYKDYTEMRGQQNIKLRIPVFTQFLRSPFTIRHSLSLSLRTASARTVQVGQLLFISYQKYTQL